ncbi:replication protein A 70 kDa DNA-binding subunit C-like [Raphanus sativus]|uniref:Replication protein A 70 kDa DNA-binding subunit C-like n=1 Tax=Raphanus sativus TaxID=3726 RepID=A0A9W3DLI7_RAPSA|nr:replication protein A 70 kDa DNA-binding subunit C-like [Raphanus sativus]
MAQLDSVSQLKPFKTMWKIRVKIVRLWRQYSAQGDVMGQIVEVSHLEVVTVNGKDTNKISLELRDLDDARLPIVLWGKFAADVNEAIQTRGDESIICVLRFGKIKIWKDDRSVSNAYNVSDVALNPIMAEVAEFKSKLPKDSNALAIVESKAVTIVDGITEKEDFFVHTPRKTILELLECKQVEQGIVLCTIAAIDSDMGWYYLSCKVCAKKALLIPNENEDDGDDGNGDGFTYYCVKCKVYKPKLMPRYKLHVVVLDNTGNAKFLLFDNLAFQLLHTPCLELTGPNVTEIQEPNEIPQALTNLIGKTYLFKIGVEKENFVYKHDTFKVLKIITNEDTISEFHETSGSVGPDLSIQSEAPEGSLMLSGDSSNQTESMALTPAKRKGALIVNLEETFDQNSVTRTPCTTRIKKEKNEKSG